MEIVALVISFIAIVLSTISFFKSYEYYKYTLRPLIILDSLENKRDGLFKITIGNKGVGPAIIKSLTIKKDNRSVDLTSLDHFQKYISKLVVDTIPNLEPGTISIELGATGKASAISPGESHRVFALNFGEENNKDLEKLLDALGQAKIICEYQSIYDESFNEEIIIKKQDVSINTKGLDKKVNLT